MMIFVKDSILSLVFIMLNILKTNFLTLMQYLFVFFSSKTRIGIGHTDVQLFGTLDNITTFTTRYIMS